MGVTFSGLASGLDTGALIDQLVAAERSNATKLATKQADLNTQKSIVGGLSSAMAALSTAVRGLDLDTELRPRTATVSDARMAAAVSPSAAPAVHDLRVKQLATAQISSSKTFATQGAGVAGTGGVDITVGGVTKSVTWGATDTLESIATKITNANAGVSASVLFDGSTYRVMVTAKDSGTVAAPTFADTGTGLDLAAPGAVKIPGANSIVTIDGVDVTRPTNVISDALAGVTLTLASQHAVGDASTKLTVGLDQKALTEKVKAVVTAFNSVNSALHVQLDYTGTPKGTNTLFGDAMLRQLQQQMAAVASSAYGTSNLGVLGITRDKTGAMTLDESKLAAAVASNPNAVSDVFITNNFAGKVADLADQYTKSGTGLFAAKTTSLTARQTTLQTQIDRINRNADSLQTRLEAQFSALEQAMSKMKSQAGYLASLFG